MAERILGEAGSPRRRRFLFVPVLLVACVAMFWIAGAQAVHDTGLFELDRNAVAGAAPGDDWSTLYNGGGTPGGSFDDFTGIVNDNATPGQQFTGGGSKDNNVIDQWLWKAGEPLDKDDITNAYVASYTATVDTGETDVGDEIIYYGLDRLANNGTAQVGFWFFQKHISLSNTASGGGFKFSGEHTVGDVLVQSNFTSGGRVSNVSVFEWVGSGGSNGALNLVFAGTDCVDADPNTPGDQPLLGDDPACATANIANETAPWPYTPKSGTAGIFPLSSFFEGGVNVTRLIPDVGCFPSFMAETRSSAPFDSRLKDFALGNFQTCEASIDTTPTSSSITLGGTNTDTVTVSGLPGDPVPTGTVKFFICGPTELDNGGTPNDPADDTCKTGGTFVDVGGDEPNGETLSATGTATSDAYEPTSTGKWCFRGEYSGDDNYPQPASGPLTDSSPGECFVVVDTSSIVTDQAWTPNDSATITSGGGSALKGTVTFTLYNNATCTAGTGNVNVLYQEAITVDDGSGNPVASPVTKSTTNGDGSGTGLAADKVFHEANSPVTVSWRAVFDSTIGDAADSTGPCETSSNLAIDDNDPTP